MPRYLYVCKKCGHQMELQRSVAKRNAWTPCPVCYAEMELKVTGPAFVLKGEGWPGKEGKKS